MTVYAVAVGAAILLQAAISRQQHATVQKQRRKLVYVVVGVGGVLTSWESERLHASDEQERSREYENIGHHRRWSARSYNVPCFFHG